MRISVIGQRLYVVQASSFESAKADGYRTCAVRTYEPPSFPARFKEVPEEGTLRIYKGIARRWAGCKYIATHPA